MRPPIGPPGSIAGAPIRRQRLFATASCFGTTGITAGERSTANLLADEIDRVTLPPEPHRQSSGNLPLVRAVVH